MIEKIRVAAAARKDMNGSTLPFARTRELRESTGDPRPSIAERYVSRNAYLEQINASAAALVKDGFLLAEDVPVVVARATSHWDLLMGSSASAGAGR